MARKKPKKIGIKTILTYLAWIFGIPATMLTTVWISLLLYNYFFNVANLVAPMTKYNTGNNILYFGRIENNSTAHAYDFSFKGEFKNGYIEYITAKSNVDYIGEEDMKYSNLKDYVFFPLKKFSRKSVCNIDINVAAKNEVKEDIQLSWDKGSLTIIPKLLSEESEHQYKSISDFNSYNARKRNLERNNVGQIK